MSVWSSLIDREDDFDASRLHDSAGVFCGTLSEIEADHPRMRIGERVDHGCSVGDVGRNQVFAVPTGQEFSGRAFFRFRNNRTNLVEPFFLVVSRRTV